MVMTIEPAPRAAEADLAELHAKLDRLTAQVEYLTAQARANERARQDRAELLRDVAPLANEAMRLTTEQLEEIQDYVQLDDIFRLFKRLLRNTANLERMLDQLESVSELVDTVMPLTDSAFGQAVDALQALEQKGYFALAQEGIRIADTVATSFTPEDVRQLGANIVLILNVVKDLTQPEILTFVQNTLRTAGQEVQAPVETSVPALLGQMRDPNVRRGLALTLRTLRAVGAQASPH